MTKKKVDMEQCQTCKHLDREKSNKQWTVCPFIPFEVIWEGTSKNCKKYEKIT